MEYKLAVDRVGDLTRVEGQSHQPQNPVIRLVAKVISYVFHPLFIPVLIGWYLVTIQPYLFSNFSAGRKALTLVQFFLMYSFFPLVTVLLSKALGFLDSIYLKTQKERVIPYIACGVYYFWMCYVFRNQPEYPKEVVQLAIGIFISSWAGLIANIFMKVSMHGLSMGLLLVFMAMMTYQHTLNATIYMSIAVMIAGLVCTARLVVSDHRPREIYIGLLLGAISQLAGVGIDKILP
jgi:hypothetical protein